MVKADILVTVVAVVRDHASVIPLFVEGASEVLRMYCTNYEVLLIDNGSIDNTENVVKYILGCFPCVRYVRLTRPTDDENALMAGLDAAIGDYVVTINPDLDPPSEMVAMVEMCRSGHDLVLGVERTPLTGGLIYAVFRQLFLGLYWQMVGVQLVTGTTGYRAISRQGVNALVKVRQRRRYFAIISAEVGLKHAIYPYDLPPPRSARWPSRRLLPALRIGLSVLVHNSITPLRLVSGLGLLGSLLSLSYSLYVIVMYMLKPDVMPGWTTLSLAMSGLFALAFVMLALMGEYLGRVLEESTDRPLYHVRDELSSTVKLTDPTRINVLDRSEDSFDSLLSGRME